MWQKTKYTFGGLLVLFVIIVTFQNTEQVDARLLLTTISLPLALLLFATLLIGFVLGALTTGIVLARRRKKTQPPQEAPATE